MKLNLLGSGGVAAPPKPCCNCKICIEARTKGIPYARTGASLFIYDSNLLFDTPEEVRTQINRENIKDIENIILTHWHPDHTLGLRVVEQINYDSIKEKPIREPIKVYIATEQYEQMKKYTAGNVLAHFESKGIISIMNFEHKKVIDFGDVKVIPLFIPETEGFYFKIEDAKSSIVYAPCEYKNLKIYEEVKDIDVFIVHHLYFENKSIGTGADYSSTEDSFEVMLEHSKQMKAKKIIITHIEEAFGLSHYELNEICRKEYTEYNIEFGFDGMILEL